MLRRRFLAVAGVCGVFVVLAVVFLRWTPPTPLPKVELLRSDPSEIVDDDGSELQLVTVRITNTLPPRPPFDPSHGLYVLVEARDFGTKVPETSLPRRAPASSTKAPHPVNVAPGMSWDITILTPSPGNRVRLRLRYAGPSWGIVSRYAVSRGMQRLLPQRLFANFNPAFWSWAGVPTVHHRMPWKEAELDLNLTTSGPEPIRPTAREHDYPK